MAFVFCQQFLVHMDVLFSVTPMNKTNLFSVSLELSPIQSDRNCILKFYNTDRHAQ